MKKIFLILFFVLILFAGDRFFGYAISKLFSFSKHNIAMLYSNKLEGEIIILGNSRAYRHFDQNTISNLFNYKVINLSELGASTLVSQTYFFDYLEKNRKPKMIIIELSNIDTDHASILKLRPFQGKSERINKLLKFYYKKYFYAGMVSSLFKYNNFNTINIIHKIFTEPKYINIGQRREVLSVADGFPELLYPYNWNHDPFRRKGIHFHKTNLNSLKEIVKKCNYENIEIKLIYTPIGVVKNLEAYLLSRTNFFNIINKEIPNQKIWDFSWFDSLEASDFYDSNHLNQKGVNKLINKMQEDKFF